MGQDLITYLRTEYISAALITNQTPRDADVCLQLGTNDGRIVQFVPRTMRKLITSSLESNGEMTISVKRQLRQQNDRRKAGLTMEMIDQRADDLKEVEDESVDVVVSMMAVEKMIENGIDWQKSLIEATRVLKPGGRFLFVEPSVVDGLEYEAVIRGLNYVVKGTEGGEEEREPVFDDIGTDDIDLVIQPHIAGVAVKALDAGMTAEEKAAVEKKRAKEAESERAFLAFERGRKRRKKNKKNDDDEEKED